MDDDKDLHAEYAEELHLDRKRQEGWHLCKECNEWLHDEDIIAGLSCECKEERIFDISHPNGRMVAS